MIVGRGEVKSFLFDKNEYTIETAKKNLKEYNFDLRTDREKYIDSLLSIGRDTSSI